MVSESNKKHLNVSINCKGMDTLISVYNVGCLSDYRLISSKLSSNLYKKICRKIYIDVYFHLYNGVIIDVSTVCY